MGSILLGAGDQCSHSRCPTVSHSLPKMLDQTSFGNDLAQGMASFAHSLPGTSSAVVLDGKPRVRPAVAQEILQKRAPLGHGVSSYYCGFHVEFFSTGRATSPGTGSSCASRTRAATPATDAARRPHSRCPTTREGGREEEEKRHHHQGTGGHEELRVRRRNHGPRDACRRRDPRRSPRPRGQPGHRRRRGGKRSRGSV